MSAVIERARWPSAAGIVHGFTTRLGGCSEGACAGLNLGLKAGDRPEHVVENYRRVGAEGGFDPAELAVVRQVHGATVLDAATLSRGAEADGLILRRGSAGPRVIGVRTADCVPVLLADREATVVAAVHSGWRGTVAGVVPAAIEAMARHGIGPERMLAAIGPCISVEAFEVGPEVAAHFPGETVTRADWPRPHVDLVAAVRRQLRAAGLTDAAIQRVGGCTHGTPDRYFSYRRDGAGTGQHLSFVGFTGPERSEPRSGS